MGPEVFVTGEEANFIFERLHWIREGEVESFKMRAPSTMKFDDICTLSRLLLDEDFEEARELVKCNSRPKTSFRTSGKGASPSIAGSTLPESPMEHLKKNAGEGWKKERDNTRAAMKDAKTYIQAPLMKKKAKKVTKTGRRGEAERRSSGWKRAGELIGGSIDGDTNPKTCENSDKIRDGTPSSMDKDSAENNSDSGDDSTSRLAHGEEGQDALDEEQGFVHGRDNDSIPLEEVDGPMHSTLLGVGPALKPVFGRADDDTLPEGMYQTVNTTETGHTIESSAFLDLDERGRQELRVEDLVSEKKQVLKEASRSSEVDSDEDRNDNVGRNLRGGETTNYEEIDVGGDIFEFVDDSFNDEDYKPPKRALPKLYSPSKQLEEIVQTKVASPPAKALKIMRTPPEVFKARRDETLEQSWRQVGGRTPDEEPKKSSKYGSFNKDLLSMLVHMLAKSQKKDLSKEPLKPSFFKDLVQHYGNVPGSAKLAPYTSYEYIMKKWRELFTIKVVSSKGSIKSDVHRFDYPQERKIPCPLCSELMQNNPRDQLLQKLSDQIINQGGVKDNAEMSAHVEIQNGAKIAVVKSDIKGKSKDKEVCPHCHKDVGNLNRHIKENCRANRANLVECPRCGMEVIKRALPEHLNGRVDKKSGNLAGACKGKAEKDKAERVKCNRCGILTKDIKRHMKDSHLRKEKIMASQSTNLPKIQNNKDTEQVGSYQSVKPLDQHKKEPKQLPASHSKPQRAIYLSETRILQMVDGILQAVDDANFRAQQKRSIQEQEKSFLSQAQMVEEGQDFLLHMLTIQASGPQCFVERDGDCLFSSLVLIQNPNIAEEDIAEAALALRKTVVGKAIRMVGSMTDQELQELQIAATTDAAGDEWLSQEALLTIMRSYLERGQWGGGLGDLMPQICSSFLGTPIFVIDINDSHGKATGYLVKPNDVFRQPQNSSVPFVVVRQSDHFIPLMVPVEYQEVMETFYNSALHQPLREADIQLPLAHKDGKSISASGPQGAAQNSMSVRKGSANFKCKPGKKLAPPDPAMGDRKKLLENLQLGPSQFIMPVEELLKKLDNLLIESPSVLDEMASQEEEVDQVLKIVRAWASGREGKRYDAAVIDVSGEPSDSSSIVTYERVLRKILPFLRSHIQARTPTFKLTDLIGFGSPGFTLLQEEMVIECNHKVGKTTAVKKGNLIGWTALCKAIPEAAGEVVNIIGYEKVKGIREYYDDLEKRIGRGVTRMKSFYEKSRKEKKQSQLSREQMPMGEAIKLWIRSEKRSELYEEVTETAAKIKSGRGATIVTAREYSAFSEFVQTELSVYGPVRIGAFGRMTVRMFLNAEPAWSSSEHGFDKTRPVTIPPPTACPHQRNPRATNAAKCGLKENGERCCDECVPPTCFIMSNEKDKGNKSNSYIVIPRGTHKLVVDFITIRYHYFEHNQPVEQKDLGGNCALFINAKGRDPRATSDFKLIIFKEAVFGKNSNQRVTPQMIRSWNTTYLKNAPDAQVAAMRGAATGNTESVFHEHYNLARQSGVLEALLASFRQHESDITSVEWSQEHEERQRHDKAAIEEANQTLLFREDGTDLTSQSKPIHPHLRKQFRRELERVEPDLWSRAGGVQKGMALSQGKWIREIISVLGRAEAEQLREVIFQQYRGLEDIGRRQWSSLQSHLVRNIMYFIYI